MTEDVQGPPRKRVLELGPVMRSEADLIHRSARLGRQRTSNTDWELYESEVNAHSGCLDNLLEYSPEVSATHEERCTQLDLVTESLSMLLTAAYETSCKLVLSNLVQTSKGRGAT